TSRYGEQRSGLLTAGQPAVDLPAERALADFLVAQVRHGRVRACQPTRVGGLAVALAKLCVRGACGARVELPPTPRPDWALFGEHPAQAWVALAEADCTEFAQDAMQAGVPIH